MTLLHLAAGVAIGQTAKYVAKKVELSQSRYDRLISGLDRFDEEMSLYEGVELAKPATVVKGFAKFVKSRFKPVTVKTTTLLSQEQFEAIEQLVLRECQKRTDRSWTSTRLEGDKLELFCKQNGLRLEDAPSDWQLTCSEDYLLAHQIDDHNVSMTGGFVITCPDCKAITEKDDMFLSIEWEIPVDATENYPLMGTVPTDEVCTFAGATVKLLKLTKSAKASINVNDPLAYPVSFFKPLTAKPDTENKKTVDQTETISEFKVWTQSTFDKQGRYIGDDLIANGFWHDMGNQINLSFVTQPGVLTERRMSFAVRFQAMKGLEDAQPYVGRETEIAQSWRAFMDQKTPVTVLLDGAPGCGKTTLVRDLIKRWSDKRTLSIGLDILERYLDTGRSITWLAELWRADIVWIDDIDRLPKARLEVLLAQLDRANCKIPLLLLTTNNFKKLPPALYRAGRVDYIYTIAMQEESVRGLIRSILTSEGLTEADLQDHHWGLLIKAAAERSGAYLVKYIRRGKVLGNMDLMMDPDDLDFNVTNDL